MSSDTFVLNRLTRARVFVAAVLSILLAGTFGLALAQPAQAASNADVSISPFIPATSPATQPVGSQFEYRIDYTCSNCANVQLSIPVGGAAGLYFAAYRNTQFFPTSVVGGNLIIDVGAVDGSFNLTLLVNGPSGPTADGTTWTFTPTIIADTLAPVTSTSSVTGTYTAGLIAEIDKSGPTSSKLVGDTFEYEFRVECWGRYADTVTITDPLPAGLQFVSATNGGTYSNGTVTWNLAGADLGGTCGPGSPVVVKMTVMATSAVLNGAPFAVVDNTASVDIVSLDGATSSDTSTDSVTIYDVTTYPPGDFTKFAFSEGGLGGNEVFPGHTVVYQLMANQPRDGYRTSIVDPLPCRTNLSGTTYSSLSGGALCTDPLVAITRIDSLDTVPAGWAPQVRLTDGTTQTLTGPAPWTPPAGVAEIIFPELPIPDADDDAIFNVHGTMTSNIADGSIVRNIATATFRYPDDSTSTVTSVNQHLIVDKNRLYSGKTLSSLNGWNNFLEPYQVGASGTIETRTPLTDDMVITDLLPAGHYVRSDYPMSVIMFVDGWHTLTAPIEIIDDFNGSGRQMVRTRISAAELNSFVTDWSVVPTVLSPSLRFSAQAPAPGSFDNSSQVFTTDEDATGTSCPAPRTSLYQDVDDLDSNPATTVGCTSTYTLIMRTALQNTGFTVMKAVQGDLDPGFVSGPNAGTLSGDGASARYLVTWTNVTDGDLDDPVVYDVLPRIDDTRVSSTDARDSEFDVLFAGIASVPAGVTVEYSTAANPCRPEVLAVNPGCVDDWSSTPPADLTTVTALKFSASGAFAPNSFLQFTIDTTASGAAVDQMAWNSAAADASQDGADLFPFESEDVGLWIPGANPPAEPSFVKTVDAATAVPGDTLTYTLSTTNPSRTPLPVMVLDVLPAGAEFVSAWVPPAETYPEGTFPGLGAALVWGQDGSLVVPAQGTLDITVTVKIDADTAGTTLVNFGAALNADTGETLDVSSGQCTTLDFAGSCAQTAVVAPAPALDLEKQICTEADAAACDPADDSVWAESASLESDASAVWRLVVRNTGNVPLTDVVVSDDLPAELDDATDVEASVGDASAFPTEWTIDSLAVGEQGVLTFQSGMPAEGESATNVASAVVNGPQVVSPVTDDATVTAKRASTPEPTITPTPEPSGTSTPTGTPTPQPTDPATPEPTDTPTPTPTGPLAEPTDEPTAGPTDEPTAGSTDEPTDGPSAEPTAPPEALPATGLAPIGASVLGASLLLLVGVMLVIKRKRRMTS